MKKLRISDNCQVYHAEPLYHISMLNGICAILLFAGCTATNPPPPPPPEEAEPDAPEVVAAEKLFEKGKLKDSIIACVDISRKNPEAHGLTDLQTRITTKLAEQREEEAIKRSAMMKRLHSADARSYSVPPDTYKQQKHVMGENAPLRTAPTAMQKALKNPVTIHLINANLSTLIAQIGQSQNVNMIADSALSDLEQTITIHVEKTPLAEVLEYIGRNLNVNFSVGNNIIWVTPKEEKTTGLPLETRIYKLRKGLVGSELGRYPYGKTIFKGPEERGQSRSEQEIKSGDAKEGKIGLLETIDRFVPQPEGADFLFNDKAHVLIAKNTRENLELIEDIIEKLDVRPLQVLIEARFVTTDVNDLKELGIDWLVDNRGGSRFVGKEITFTDKDGEEHTVVRGKDYGKDTFPSAAQFAHDALVGSTTKVMTDDFGNAKSGGLSLGYQFLLGDTALQAVLHALQQNGESEILAVPRVTTLNNREARFRIGEDVVYYEEVEAESESNSRSYSDQTILEMTFDWDTPMTLEIGYSLTVTPSVGADLSTINLVLRPEISDVVQWREYKVALARNNKGESSEVPNIQLPVVSRQYIETETTVRSGETVILGGLVNTKKVDTDTNTPWLSTLPLIGNLFKMEDKHTKTQNVLVFVTATLISDIGESLIPLNEYERYGEEVKPEDIKPDILKTPKEQKEQQPPAVQPAAGQPNAPTEQKK